MISSIKIFYRSGVEVIWNWLTLPTQSEWASFAQCLSWLFVIWIAYRFIRNIFGIIKFLINAVKSILGIHKKRTVENLTEEQIAFRQYGKVPQGMYVFIGSRVDGEVGRRFDRYLSPNEFEKKFDEYMVQILAPNFELAKLKLKKHIDGGNRSTKTI